MNKSIQYLLSLLFFIQISCQEKKDHKKTKAMTKYEWLDATSAPLGYPVDVYRGGLESSDGEFTSLYSGTTGGSWGEANRGMSNGIKSVPDHLHVIWVSYAEKIFYEIDTDIDYDKMYALFQKGYLVPSTSKDNPQPRKENYDQIIVGFAPGGTVVVWLSGAGRQIEIGKYQGKKIEIPKSEIDALSPGPQKNMFDAEYQRKVMHEFGIVPKEVAQANEGKSIPYKLWDTYRQRYNWRTVFEFPNKGITDEVDYYLLNGENEFLFGDTQIKEYKNIPEELKWNSPKERAVPQKIYFSWFEDKEIYEGTISFDQHEITKAFESLSKENSKNEIKIVVRVNELRNFASVQLEKGGQQIWLKNNKITIN
ncbi:DUF2931 family protein [Chryseobacterium vrystaatense]|uniref:DUF2931 family protein n=1 Tax=Chryseobacterium vrystaatense TaxID=307480 RepID=A0ABR4UFW7_9FLAO|nr:DUF2931 family protein [Chryseobacterium vrystaatense]KFF23420.1 hypothetical protein IW16_24430 [Chryseobacterium vrystaatense]